jgi:hypothetical protein
MIVRRDFQRSIRPIFETSLCANAVCKYRYINQLRRQSQKGVSSFKVSFYKAGEFMRRKPE